MKKTIGKLLPWLITVFALFYAFRGVDWPSLISHLKGVSAPLIALGAIFTIISYFLRSYRWTVFFPRPVLSLTNSLRILILGFFMNNILPARAGELVRAHTGARITGETRTLVLATIAAERLADGVTISAMFVIFALNLCSPETARALLWVAGLFGGASVLMGVVLVKRTQVFQLVEKLGSRFSHPASDYTISRIRLFIEGLLPLYSPRRFPFLCFWSIVIWMIELCVYFFIQQAFHAELSWSQCVLFLVAVNFSSLIPSAPGAIGVIEAVTTAVLMSLGVEKEHALSMVLTQHAIQYLVVGLPGVVMLFTWKKHIKDSENDSTAA